MGRAGVGLEGSENGPLERERPWSLTVTVTVSVSRAVAKAKLKGFNYFYFNSGGLKTPHEEKSKNMLSFLIFSSDSLSRDESFLCWLVP